MESKELRIGNYVLARGAKAVVKSIEDTHIGYSKTKHSDYLKREHRTEEKVPLKFIQPIPLTEEWLLRFGFDKNDEHGVFLMVIRVLNKNIILECAENCVWIDDSMISCEYVHQLQNLYFALTGEELTLKQQPPNKTT